MSYFKKVKTASVGTIRGASIIDFSDDPQGRNEDTHPGFFVWMGTEWDGPFEYSKDALAHFMKTVPEGVEL